MNSIDHALELATFFIHPDADRDPSRQFNLHMNASNNKQLNAAETKSRIMRFLSVIRMTDLNEKHPNIAYVLMASTYISYYYRHYLSRADQSEPLELLTWLFKLGFEPSDEFITYVMFYSIIDVNAGITAQVNVISAMLEVYPSKISSIYRYEHMICCIQDLTDSLSLHEVPDILQTHAESIFGYNDFELKRDIRYVGYKFDPLFSSLISNLKCISDWITHQAHQKAIFAKISCICSSIKID